MDEPTYTGEDTGNQKDMFGNEKPVLIKGKPKMSQLDFDTLIKDQNNLKRWVQ